MDKKSLMCTGKWKFERMDSMTNNQSERAEGDCVIQFKAPEQLLMDQVYVWL